MAIPLDAFTSTTEREAMNIIELAKEAGFTIILGRISLKDAMNRQIDVENQITKFAELLQAQASEPVAWRNPNDNHRASAFMWQQSATHSKPLFASPPNTQQKLDKAIWALKHVKPATRNIDQNAWDTIETALKEIE
jgi:hypothetical protein